MKLHFIAALSLILAPFAAFAQSPVNQSGSVAKGHAAMWTADRTVQDAGPASGGGPNVGISNLPIVGTGTPLCIYDAPTTNSLGYHSVCIGANDGNKGKISFQAGGAAAQIPLQLCVNGSCYDFPFTGSGSGNVLGAPVTTNLGPTCFGNTTGTLIQDCGATAIFPGNVSAANLTAATTVFAVAYDLTGKEFATSTGTPPYFVIFNPDNTPAINLYDHNFVAGGVTGTFNVYTAHSHEWVNEAGTPLASLGSTGIFNLSGNMNATGSITSAVFIAPDNGGLIINGRTAIIGEAGLLSIGPDNTWTNIFIGNTTSPLTLYGTAINTSGPLHVTGGASVSTDLAVNGNIIAVGNISTNAGQVTGALLASSGNVNAANQVNSTQYNLRGLTFATMPIDASFTQIDDPANSPAIIIWPTSLQNQTVFESGQHTFRDRGAASYFAVFNASGTANNSGSWTVISDDHVKENVVPYTAGLAAIKTLNPVELNYIPPAKAKAKNIKPSPFAEDPPKLHYGLMASNVQPILPEMVSTTNFVSSSGEPTSLASLAPTHLVYVLINAAKELDARIAGLETKPIIVGKAYKFNTITGVNGTTFAIGDIAGTHEMILMVTGSGAATMTTPTAAEIIAAVPGWDIGGDYRLRIANPTAGVITIAPGAGVTITGLNTTAASKWREYLVRYMAANSVDFRDVGSGNE